MQNYSTTASRNLIRAEQKMLRHAEPIIVLGKFGVQKEQPKNITDTIVFRRLNPFNATGAGVPNITASNFVLSEGTTPTPNTISYQDVSVTLQQYGVLFKYSSKVEDMYEDNIPDDMAKLTGETLAEVKELVQYGVVKGGTGVIYANGASRAAVNTTVSLNKLRKAARTLQSNRAGKVTEILSPSVQFGTKSVEKGYIVFHHTDCNSDVRDLPGFTRVADYGQRKPICDEEVGSCEEFRFIGTPLLAPFLAAGSATINGMVSQGAANVDVYPMIVMAADCWGQVALKGRGAISPTKISAKVKNHANPMGQFGYVGADFYYATVRLNENFMTRLEVGVTDL